MKLPKLFGRKSAKPDDEYDYDDDDDDLDGAAESGDRRAGSRDDDHVDEDDMVGGGDDDDDDEELEVAASRPDRRLLILMAGGSGLAVILVVSAAAWWFFGSTDGSAPKAVPSAISTPTHVVLEVAPRPKDKPQGPQVRPGEKLSATDTLNAIAALSTGPGAGIVVNPVQKTAYRGVLPVPKAPPLPKAPDPALVEQSPVGPLPKVSDDGRTPWQTYARPFQAAEGTPLVAIVFTGLGLNRATTEAAITYLPPEVTFALDPYGTDLADWMTTARDAGHEILLGLPLEPADFPTRDPGPLALITGSSTSENIQRLNFLLSRISGYMGVLTLMGSRFTQEEEQMRPILDILKRRGLMYVDSVDGKSAAGLRIAKEIELPRGFVDLVLDTTPSQTGINRQLALLERLAREKGFAVAVARPYPISISRVAGWITSLGKQGIIVAPVSGIANRQPLP